MRIEYTGEYWIAIARSVGKVVLAEGDTRSDAFYGCVQLLRMDDAIARAAAEQGIALTEASA